MISKKRVKNSIFEVIELLRAGKTGFIKTKAMELADRLEQAIEDTDPALCLSDCFFLPLHGKMVRCRFATMPEHIPYRKKRGVYYINSKKKMEFLAGDL